MNATSRSGTHPRVSVVIPLFNHERYIEAAIESVLGQSLPPDEVIVVDDGSTDTSASKVRGIAASNPRILFWSQPNQGADYTLNAGIHRATGEFLAILNSDDLYLPDRLETCVGVLVQRPEVSAVATGLTFVDAEGAEIPNAWYEDALGFFARTQDLALGLIHANFFVTTSNLVARRSLFDEIGYFSPLRYAHDLDLYLRLLARGKRVQFLPQPLLRYRSHGANTIEEDQQRVRVERAAAIASFILNARAERGADPQAWRAFLDRIAEITDAQALTGFIEHFLAHYQPLGWPCVHLARASSDVTPEPLVDDLGARFPLRSLPKPLATELTLAQQSERIDAQEEAITALQRALENKRLAFLQQETNIAALRAELEEKRLGFRQQDANITALRAELEAKRLGFRQQEANIASLRAELEQREQTIAILLGDITEKSAGVAALAAELERWKRSRGYLITELWSSPGARARKLARILYLLAGGMAPERIRRKVRPLVGRSSGHSQSRDSIAPAPPPYQVRMPAAQAAPRPRIAHAIANFFTGGSSRLVVDLIEHLGDRYEQEVITSCIPEPPAYVGLPIWEIQDPEREDELTAYLQRFRPDLVHVHYWGDCDRPWYAAVFRAAELAGCRVIENVNTPVEPYVDANIAEYVYVSTYVLSRFGRPNCNNRVIYPGSDFQLFSAKRDCLPQPDCIGMVYRLESDKLNEESIEVFLKVVKRRPGTRALIVGGGAFLEGYKAKASAAGLSDAFTFTGYVPYEQLPAFYARMTLFVAPVWQESFGQVSPFAMSMGMPVVGFDVGALGEILGSDEFLVPPGDSDRLADVIIRLLDDPERVMAVGQANQQRVQALFSVQAMIDRYAELYHQVVA